MEVNAILHELDQGSMALPVFQRGYVWKPHQVRALFTSLYRDYPVGSLLLWKATSDGVATKGDKEVPQGTVDLLLDGQQRLTSVYGVARGVAPAFFEGDERSFTGLWFHLGDEVFEFHQPKKMASDPLWMDVTSLLRQGFKGVPNFQELDLPASVTAATCLERSMKLLSILSRDIPEQRITHTDADEVVEIFNRVNSQGTTLSKGDLALAKISVEWPEARDAMNRHLHRWSKRYTFDRDWLLRSVNTVVTGRADFKFLHNRTRDQVEEGLKRAAKSIDKALNLISARLGLDHDRVLFGRYAMPIMAHYLDRRSGPLSPEETGKLLYWFVQAAIWGRFSGATESKMEADLNTIEELDGGIDRLIEQLRLSRGNLQIEPDHFDSSSVSARFYPLLYMLTRMGESRDLCAPHDELKYGMLGINASLELHHVFPKKVLYDNEYAKKEVNALANFCFLTKECNIQIAAKSPAEYMSEIPLDVLRSQWIPTDPGLWKVENYKGFLKARRELLAGEANRVLDTLLPGDWRRSEHTDAGPEIAAETALGAVLGGIESEAEERTLEEVSHWMRTHGLAPGEISFSLDDEETGAQRAILDLAWPSGVQEGLSERVALVLNEGPELVAFANNAGYRCFTSERTFKRYVENEVLSGAEPTTLR